MDINCFVGLAIRDEINFVYQNGIKVALDKSGVIPRRVDKLIHNERIDSKIRDEIKNSNFMIADLTFERPSVYWEAGFAERKNPVIYTCRKDHLEENSGVKVHFDLANANIIPWEENKMGEFIDSLYERIQLILEPIRETKEKDNQIEVFQKEFNSLSIKEQRKTLSLIMNNSLDNNGYSNCIFLPKFPSYLGYASCKYRRKDTTILVIQPVIESYPKDYLEIKKDEDYYKIHESTLGIFTFFEFGTGSFINGSAKDFLSNIRISTGPNLEDTICINEKIFSGIDSIRKILIFITKFNFKISELEKNWYTMKKGVNDFHLYDPDIVSFYLPSGREPYISHEIIVFENIKSFREFEEDFNHFFSIIEISDSTIDRTIYPAGIVS